MFENIEIRKARNGVIVVVREDSEDREYIFDTDRKALRFVKELLEKPTTQSRNK